jgi:hypothetical protein
MNKIDKIVYKQLAKTLDRIADAMISVAKSIDEVHDQMDIINKKLNKSGGKK